ncbi:MAG TPA: hypothetical protein VNQ74_01000, partial [Burkholderiaceae bacterium]|nr:hypothetical protein [Burkholderiaceae bacterium]
MRCCISNCVVPLTAQALRTHDDADHAVGLRKISPQFARADINVFGEQAFARYGLPDASLWEYRGRQEVHTFSALMCWAG